MATRPAAGGAGAGRGGAGLKCGRLGHCGGSRAVWLETLSPILIPRTGLSCNVHCSHTCCCLPYVVRKICLKVWIASIFHSTRSLCFEEWKMNLILDTEWPSQYWSCPPSTSTNTPHNGNVGVRTTLYFLTVFQSASLTTVLKKKKREIFFRRWWHDIWLKRLVQSFKVCYNWLVPGEGMPLIEVLLPVPSSCHYAGPQHCDYTRYNLVPEYYNTSIAVTTQWIRHFMPFKIVDNFIWLFKSSFVYICI